MAMQLDNIKYFEELQQNITKLGDKWRDTAAQSDKSQTFAGIQNRMHNTRFFVENERKELNRQIDDLSKVWSKDVMSKKEAGLRAKFSEFTKTINTSMRKDIESLIASKKEALADMLATPPTADQLRLLQSLQMRGDSLDSVELATIMPTLFGNYQAMRILQNIGEQSGNKISLPVQLDCREMFNNLENVRSYLMTACNYLTAKPSDVPLEYHAFYSNNPEEEESHFDPIYNDYIEVLDAVPQLNNCEVNKTRLNRTESAIVDYLFKPVEGLDSSDSVEDIKILKHTQAVMSEHPDIVGLLKLSDYGKYVDEVEAVQSEEA